jgi:hypothetical protein
LLSRDDGFLTASEITSLKLDAGWAIVSARNTAAGMEGEPRRFPGWRAPSSMRGLFTV